VPPLLLERLAATGVRTAWSHQVTAAELGWAGRSVITATGTASGKSLCYLLPALSAVLRRDATVLYLSPSKALAADQLSGIRALDLPGVRAATYDGDTPREERDWTRRHANVLLSNPDMLHRGVLPHHPRWTPFWRRLQYVVVDECHHYRGVFGSHVALILRRLRRVCAAHGASPAYLLASATVATPALSAARLIGTDVTEVVTDGSPRGRVDLVLWEPGPADVADPDGPRRSATTEAAELLADLVVAGVPSLAFVRSRRGAEGVASLARRLLAEAAPELVGRVAAYRGGYLPEERRALEADLRQGRLLGMAATSALELGVDLRGLDAVVLAGYPGTVASMWQQVGRAGRRGDDALAILIARDDPLDTYFLRHPKALVGRPVEATVLDPDNPYVLAPHLAAAAQELPLNDVDVAGFGPTAKGVLRGLANDGLVRRRAGGWYCTARGRAVDAADLRGTGGEPVAVVEVGTGRLLGTVDADSADLTVHRGAIYLHQGETYLVGSYDLDDGVAIVEQAEVGFSTWARRSADIAVVERLRRTATDTVTLNFGTVDVTTQVIGFLRRRVPGGEVLGEEPLDLPRRSLRTRAVWWTATPALLALAGVAAGDVPGAAHAAEHAAIGLLPLVATCDRWDVGGVSTALHPDTGLTTVFVYDGAPGGAGFAERGFVAARRWLTATRDAIAHCRCEDGCPSCVHSPKCGNGNSPLRKASATRLLTAVLGDMPAAKP
jgi:DEAD/DEAH box helicase domain-containing protein